MRDRLQGKQKVLSEILKSVFLARNKKLPNSCIVCKALEVTTWGVWQPNAGTSVRLGVPKEKVRMFAYALCERCKELPDVQKTVEQRLILYAERVSASELFNKEKTDGQ